MAQPNLNVEFAAVSDVKGKFSHLAKLLGLADADHARGKCEHLWMACTTRGETDLPRWLVEQHLGERGPEALVEAELAKWGGGRGDSKTRRLRISGARKHCTWMASNQEQSSKAGKVNAKTANRVMGKFAPKPTIRNHPSDPDPDPPIPEIPDHTPSRAILPAAAPAAVAVAPPPRDADQLARDREARRSVQLEVRAELEAARADVAREHELEDHGLLAQDPGERDLAMHLVNAGPDGLAAAREQALHAIAIKTLEARRDRTLKGMTLGIFAGRQFGELVSMRPEDVAAVKRRGPRAAPAIRATPEQIAGARYVLERLSADSGVSWRVEDGHHARIIELLSDGHSALELRSVATYCGDEWKADDKMQRHLRPDVVFGSKFTTYLAQARARYGHEIRADDNPTRKAAT